jgi:uncharacterized protein Usg
LRYLNKNGAEISKAAWENAIRSKEYVAVRASKSSRTEITTSWVGVHVPDVEPVAKPFLTTVKEMKTEEPHIRNSVDYWSGSLEEAISDHERLCVAHGVPMKEEKR